MQADGSKPLTERKNYKHCFVSSEMFQAIRSHRLILFFLIGRPVPHDSGGRSVVVRSSQTCPSSLSQY